MRRLGGAMPWDISSPSVPMRRAVDGALTFALEMTLRLELSDDVLVHVGEVDGRAAELVALRVELRQVRGCNRFELLLGDGAVEIQVAIGKPLGKPHHATLGARRETVEEEVV